jgi:ABC-type glycerol-3-phosphate transport system substrate-binding protein
MKKAITLALVLVLALSLAACGGNSGNGSGSTTTPPPSNSGTTPPSGDTTPATSSTAGNSDSNNNGDKWEDNEFTKQVPKPADEVVYFLDSADHITVQFVTPDNNDGIRAYIEQLKSAGFTENADSFEYQDQIRYEADNSAGYHVEVYRNGYDEDWTLSVEKN